MPAHNIPTCRQGFALAHKIFTFFSNFITMGKDHTTKQHARSGHRTAPKSDNVYLKLLVKLYSFLARKYLVVS